MPRILALIAAAALSLGLASTAQAKWVTAGSTSTVTEAPACRNALAWSFATFFSTRTPREPQPPVYHFPELLLNVRTSATGDPLPRSVVYRGTHSIEYDRQVIPDVPFPAEFFFPFPHGTYDYVEDFVFFFDRVLLPGTTVQLRRWIPDTGEYRVMHEYTVADCWQPLG